MHNVFKEHISQNLTFYRNSLYRRKDITTIGQSSKTYLEVQHNGETFFSDHIHLSFTYLCGYNGLRINSRLIHFDY